MKTIVSVWACLVIPGCLVSQSATDIQVLIAAADELRNQQQYERAWSVADSARQLSQKTGYQKGIADSYMQMGRALKEVERYHEALLAYESALRIREDKLHDRLAVAKTYNSMTSAALEAGEPQKAYGFSNGALTNCHKDSVQVLARIYNNRANVYEALDSLEKAIAVNRMAIDLFRQTHDTLTRIETGYGLAKKLIGKNFFPEGKTELESALSILKNHTEPDTVLRGRLYELYGNYYLNLPECVADSAIAYFTRAQVLFQSIPDNDINLAYLLFNFGEAFHTRGDLETSLTYYYKSLKILQYHKDGGAATIQAIVDRTEAEIENEHAQKSTFWWRAVSFLALIILTIVSYTLYLTTKASLRKEKLLRAKDLENAQLILQNHEATSQLIQQNHQLRHDIVKNGLQAIDNYIKSEMDDLKREDVGYPVLQKTENMISRMLNKVGYPVAGTQEATTLKPFVRELHLQAEEIFRGAQNYSFLEGVDDYPVSKVLRGQLEAIVTEAFTNIYKYADCTVASLCVEVDENGLTLTMEDNGKGFDPQQVAQSGLRNIELRTYEINGRYKIISEPGKGTQIKIVVPAFPERSE